MMSVGSVLNLGLQATKRHFAAFREEFAWRRRGGAGSGAWPGSQVVAVRPAAGPAQRLPPSLAGAGSGTGIVQWPALRIARWTAAAPGPVHRAEPAARRGVEPRLHFGS
jgi:hypothetical protein